MGKYVKYAVLLILITFAAAGCFFPSGRTADSPEDLAKADALLKPRT